VHSAFLAFTALLQSASPGPDRLPPVEQCQAEPGLSQFRADLHRAVVRKDQRALIAMLADDVEVNFGGDRGPELFAANWKFDEPVESHVWAELREALDFGCAPSGDAFVAPSFVTQFPDALDPFDTIIARPGAWLRRGRQDSAEGRVQLDWHLATVTDDSHSDWLGVKLIDGRRGFVRRGETISPLDYRLVFEKRAGQWLITAFVAGD
jgi:hypothetical protein